MGTTVRDNNECERTVMEKKKMLRKVCGVVLAGEALLPVKWLKIKLWLGRACGS